MNIEIKQIIVLVREHGMDKIIIHTDSLPPTAYPWDENGSLVMNVAKGAGEKYVLDNFGISPDVVHC